MNVPLCSSVTACRNSSGVFMTIGPYNATGSSIGLPDTQQKTDAFFAGLNGNLIPTIEQNERVIPGVVLRIRYDGWRGNAENTKRCPAPIGTKLQMTAPRFLPGSYFRGVLPLDFCQRITLLPVKRVLRENVSLFSADSLDYFPKLSGHSNESPTHLECSQHQDSAKARPTDWDARWFAERRCGTNCKQSREPLFFWSPDACLTLEGARIHEFLSSCSRSSRRSRTPQSCRIYGPLGLMTAMMSSLASPTGFEPVLPP
jgi:hypothetical protein